MDQGQVCDYYVPNAKQNELPATAEDGGIIRLVFDGIDVFLKQG